LRSLTLRIFLSFWLIILLLTGLAALAGYAYSERLREALDNFETRDTVLAASDALEQGGPEALRQWLRELPDSLPMDVYVVDRAGRDLLERPVPEWARRMMRRHGGRRGTWRSRQGEPSNLRAARPLTRLRGPDGKIFTLFVSPKRHPFQEWLGARAGPLFLLIALLISGAVSWVLARAISKPVRAFRDATVAIAAGRLDTRLPKNMHRRRDEIGMLAHDIDAMTATLQHSANRQLELTRNVSHELRSPLARLRVALELARREAGDLSEFRRIDQETERLDALIGQLLRYSQLEGDEHATTETLVVGELLSQIVDDANFECGSSGLEGVSVSLQCEEELPVRANRTALASAFENVLRNAIYHSPSHSTVTVTASRQERHAIVQVCDAGSGVADDQLDRLFEPFYRSPDALASGRSGTGLGLAIAARAVKTVNGHIAASNTERGFVIEIRLPLANSETA